MNNKKIITKNNVLLNTLNVNFYLIIVYKQLYFLLAESLSTKRIMGKKNKN